MKKYHEVYVTIMICIMQNIRLNLAKYGMFTPLNLAGECS